MAVKSYALTTAQRVADFGVLGTLADSKLTRMERIVDSITEYIENYLGYRIKETAYTNQEYSTESAQSLNLENFPVSSSATFAIQRRNSALDNDNWETIDSSFYHVDFDSGIIHAAGGWEFSRTTNGFRVTYTAGYSFDNSTTFLSDTQAGDIEMIVWEMCLATYSRKGGSLGVKSEKLGDYSIVYGASLMEDENVKAILDKYAKIDVLGVLTPLQL